MPHCDSSHRLLTQMPERGTGGAKHFMSREFRKKFGESNLKIRTIERLSKEKITCLQRL